MIKNVQNKKRIRRTLPTYKLILGIAALVSASVTGCNSPMPRSTAAGMYVGTEAATQSRVGIGFSEGATDQTTGKVDEWLSNVIESIPEHVNMWDYLLR